MVLEFPCPSCGAAQKAEVRLAGRTLKCRRCQNKFIIPAAEDTRKNLPDGPPARQPGETLDGSADVEY